MNFAQSLKLNVPKLNFLNFGILGSTIGGVVGAYLLAMLFLTWWWDKEPSQFDVLEVAASRAEMNSVEPVIGYTFAHTNRELAATMLQKRGGFLSNDVFPPGVWMDNIPAWEFGVLLMVRDTARSLRVDLARTQSQSNEEPNLAEAEGKFFYDNSSWIFPASEDEYKAGIEYLEQYLASIANPNNPDAQFYPRADNLQRWLGGVSARLGDISQRLSESVGKRQRDLATFGERNPDQSTPAPSERETKTPWTQIDDVFYEARGQAWALLHLLKAVEHDFRPVLDDKNALPMLQQIIRDLEATQETVWSPVILNGGGFGFLANHSLVMASYISRVNAAIIEIQQLLEQG
ncbi:MAG: DUF2333 family protein [Gammaproteobacteria bacterium]|nr:DUF2333 family protein [Gammaproteobacteria bacterium]